MHLNDSPDDITTIEGATAVYLAEMNDPTHGELNRELLTEVRQAREDNIGNLAVAFQGIEDIGQIMRATDAIQMSLDDKYTAIEAALNAPR